jgi:hypothetical protein
LLFISLCFVPVLSNAASVNVVPSDYTVDVGSSFQLDVNISDVLDLYAFQFSISFNPTVLSALSITEGAFLRSGGITGPVGGTINNSAGTISLYGDILWGNVPGVNGSGTLASVSFQSLDVGTSPMNLGDVVLLDGTLHEAIEATSFNGTVNVTGITELSNTEGTIGTQVTITGSDFGTKKGKVLIGGVATNIAEDGWMPDFITCTVDKVSSEGTHDVTIKPYKAADITLSNAFTIKKPEIDPLLVDHSKPSVPINITGNFFSAKKGKVYLEYEKNGQTKKKNCKVTSWGMNRINFVVPKGLTSGKAYPLKVMNKVGIAEAPTDFTID